MKYYLNEVQRIVTAMLEGQCSILSEAKVIPFSTTSGNAKCILVVVLCLEARRPNREALFSL
jgi:hypothetical protein